MSGASMASARACWMTKIAHSTCLQDFDGRCCLVLGQNFWWLPSLDEKPTIWKEPLLALECDSLQDALSATTLGHPDHGKFLIYTFGFARPTIAARSSLTRTSALSGRDPCLFRRSKRSDGVLQKKDTFRFNKNSFLTLLLSFKIVVAVVDHFLQDWLETM